ncbi:antibiotic biosynthesis monooxygenase [Akkermansiaceae bacterium]|nr:antibiotic biosynthesis monooxygenase [Akkermansiaceae bacterium]
MSKLTIIAHIHANPEQIDLVKAELHKVIEPTRAEKGCLNYDLHQDNEDPAHFFFFENWESRELWQAHMESLHLKDFKAATEGSIKDVVLDEMTHIG